MFTSNVFDLSDLGFPWIAGAMLAFESCEVIQLRLAKLAICDGAADGEARLMVAEKVSPGVVPLSETLTTGVILLAWPTPMIWLVILGERSAIRAEDRER